MPDNIVPHESAKVHDTEQTEGKGSGIKKSELPYI